MAVDKAAAVDRSPRISEKALYVVSLVGGVWRTIAGMFLLRHKTQKIGFQGVVVFIALLNVLFLYRLLA